MDFEDNFYQFKILSRYSAEPYGFKKISNPQPGALAQYLIAKAQANPVFEQSLHAFCPKTEELINPYDTELEVAYRRACTHYLNCRCRRPFFRPTRRKERRVVILHQRLTTLLDGKMAPALRVAAKIAPCCVARHLFENTKLRSSRLAWRYFSHNNDDSNSVYRP